MENHKPPQASPSSSVDRDTSFLRDCPASRDAVWLEIEEETLDRNEELLGRYLMGLWEGDLIGFLTSFPSDRGRKTPSSWKGTYGCQM